MLEMHLMSDSTTRLSEYLKHMCNQERIVSTKAKCNGE